jgi:HSP20 family protein
MFSLTPFRKKNGSVAGRKDQDEFLPLTRLRDDFENLWDRFWKEWDRGWLTSAGQALSHWNTNWTDNGREYVFQVELPGFAPGELDVKVAGDTLTIHAEHKEEATQEHRSSYRYGTYHQSISLPRGIAADEIEANYCNGMLEIRLPKSEEGRGRRITVQPS